jgi:hypothetical protein
MEWKVIVLNAESYAASDEVFSFKYNCELRISMQCVGVSVLQLTRN